MNILITGIGGPNTAFYSKKLSERNFPPNAKLIGTDTSRLALGFYMKGLIDHSLFGAKRQTILIIGQKY